MKKFQTSWRRKTLLSNAFFLFFVVLMFVGCRQDLLSTDDLITKSIDVDVAAAKAWFNNYKTTKIALESPDFKHLEPQWHEAFATKKGIEIPILVEGKLPLVGFSNETTKKGRQRLIFNKREKGYEASVVSYMPSPTYKELINGINSNTIKEKKFSGIVSFRPLENPSRVSFLYLDNGKVTKAKVGNYVRSNSALSARKACVEYGEECTAWYQVVTVNGEIQSIEFLDEDCVPVCIQWGSDDNGDGDNGGDNGGCGSPNPPLHCGDGGDDPCSGPYPPPSCGGVGIIYDNDEDKYVCSNNFSFSSANEFSSMRQEAGISGVYAKLSPSLTINLGELYFSAPFHTSTGSLDLSHVGAAIAAADALNFGENIMREAFRSGNYTSAENLLNIWEASAIDHFQSGINGPGHGMFQAGYQVSRTQIGMNHTPTKKPYRPCD